MKRSGWFFYFLRRAVGQRRMRFAIAALSVALAVSVLIGLTGLSLGIREKLGDTLRAYGANVIVSGGANDLDAAAAERIAALPSVASAEPQLFGRVMVLNSTVEMVGAGFAKLRERGWRIDGGWPSGDGDALVGAGLREALGVKIGDALHISSDAGHSRTFRISGFVERGGDEDKAVFIDIGAAGKLLGKTGRASVILVRSRESVDVTVREIGMAMPGVTVKTLRQVAQAEESLLLKIQLLMAMVTLVVFVASIISVGSTMGATVLERREEIGLMKALGGTRYGIAAFYAAEAAAIGIAGGLLSVPAGFASAQIVSKGAFGSFINVPWYLALAGPVAGAALAVVSGWFPVRDAMKPAASTILRGE